MNKRYFWAILLGCVGVGLLCLLSFAVTRPQPTVAQKACPADPNVVAELPEKERRHCEEEVAAYKIQYDATEWARVEAEPRVVDPIPTLSPEEIKEHGTPVPPGVIPESEMIVAEFPAEDRVDGPSALRPSNAASVWRAGAVIDPRTELYGPVYVFTPSHTCGVGVMVDHSSKQFPNAFYKCPENKDMRLEITSIDLKTYTLTLKDQDGHEGAFNVLTHAWVLPS